MARRRRESASSSRSSIGSSDPWERGREGNSRCHRTSPPSPCWPTAASFRPGHGGRPTGHRGAAGCDGRSSPHSGVSSPSGPQGRLLSFRRLSAACDPALLVSVIALPATIPAPRTRGRGRTGAAHPPSGSYRCRESWRGRGPVWRVGGSCGGSGPVCRVRRRLRLGPEAAAPGSGGGCARVRRRLRLGAEAAAPGCGGSSGEVGGSGARVRGRSPPLPADPGAVRLR
jgi:hypothetical protein